MRKFLVVGLCGIILGAFAAPALASSTPSQGTYGGTGANQLSQVQNLSSDTTTTGTTASSLPFTGLNVGLVALIAVVLLGSGFALRMRSRSDRS